MNAAANAPDIKIVGGRLIDPRNRIDAVRDVYVRDGRVAAIGDAPGDFGDARCIDARGLLVLPGLIDLCARPHEPGGIDQAYFANESRAGAHGGVTRMVCPPDSVPVIDTPAMVHLIRQHADAAGYARVHPLGALTVQLAGERLADMALLGDAGCVGLSNAHRPVNNTLVMRRAMQYASTYDLTVFTTPRDPWLQGNGVVHEGEMSTRLGLPAIPEAAETVGVARDLALIETSGVRAHFELLSCARAVEMMAEAKARGLRVTAGVAVHHLHLTERHIGVFDARHKVFPPLRTERDRQALLRGIADGAIGAICSDHHPHDADAKLAPFAEAEAGIAGLDTLLALTWALVEQDALRASTAVAALTANPAAIIGIDAGHLGVGARADLCLFDPQREWKVSAQTMQSRGHNSPWFNDTLRGKVLATMIDGRTVFDDTEADE